MVKWCKTGGWWFVNDKPYDSQLIIFPYVFSMRFPRDQQKQPQLSWIQVPELRRMQDRGICVSLTFMMSFRLHKSGGSSLVGKTHPYSGVVCSNLAFFRENLYHILYNTCISGIVQRYIILFRLIVFERTYNWLWLAQNSEELWQLYWEDASCYWAVSRPIWNLESLWFGDVFRHLQPLGCVFPYWYIMASVCGHIELEFSVEVNAEKTPGVGKIRNKT